MSLEPLGVVIGGSQYTSASGDRRTYALDLLDLDDDRLRTIELHFLPHGFTTMPGRETVAALFEKRGPNACLVELTTGRVRPITAETGRAFYGHGVFAPDAQTLYAVEIDTASHEGLLTVRDARTWEVMRTVPTGGKNPHDAVLLGDLRTLVVTNGGGDATDATTDAAPSVTFVDLASSRVVDRVAIGEAAFNAGHVAIARDGSLAVVSAPRDGLPETSLGGLSLRGPGSGGTAERAREPRDVTDRMTGESLSVAIHEPTRTVLATHPYGDLFTLWSLDERRLLRAFELEAPRGVTLTLDGRFFALSHGKDGALSLVDPEARELVKDKRRSLGRFTGSHLYAWRKPEGFSFGA